MAIPQYLSAQFVEAFVFGGWFLKLKTEFFYDQPLNRVYIFLHLDLAQLQPEKVVQNNHMAGFAGVGLAVLDFDRVSPLLRGS